MSIKPSKQFILRAIAVIFLITICLFEVIHKFPLEVEAPKPNFKSMPIHERKVAFIHFMYPLIQKANQKILKERQTIISLESQVNHEGHLDKKGYQTLHHIYTKNRLGQIMQASPEDFKHLLKRIDIIPPALALAQAALESGWGTSRFAVEGNNYFGLHCFTRGCGIIPTGRAEGSTMEVTRFNTPEDGVQGYMYRLNTGSHFKSFREIRAKLRQNGLSIETTALLNGLHNYSELGGNEYMTLLKSVIQHNDLEQYDKVN